MKVLPVSMESLGTRSFCILVRIKDIKILIDPSVSLGPRRFGLKPHLDELAASYLSRGVIEKLSQIADVIIQTHYHADHFTLGVDRMYEFTNRDTQLLTYSSANIYAKERHDVSYNQQKRAYWLWSNENFEVQPADGRIFEYDDFTLEFSQAVPHGPPGTKTGSVIMSKIKTPNQCFIHTSDVMGLLTQGEVEFIQTSDLNVVFIDGPSIYHPKTTEKEIKLSIKHLNSLNCDPVVLDHHLLRTQAERQWREENLAIKTVTGAEFAEQENMLLEAHRKELFESDPVSNDFYKKLQHNDKETLDKIRDRANQIKLYQYLGENGVFWNELQS